MASDAVFKSQFAKAICFFLPFQMCFVDVSYQVLLLSQSMFTSVCDRKNTSVCQIPCFPRAKG